MIILFLIKDISMSEMTQGLSFFFAVIGRGGEQINKLQSETGAKIQVAPGNKLRCINRLFERIFLFKLDVIEKKGCNVWLQKISMPPSWKFFFPFELSHPLEFPV